MFIYARSEQYDLIGGLTYLDDKILQFHMILSHFLHVFIVNN